MTNSSLPSPSHGPPWLLSFLQSPFFSKCSHHSSERNHFCTDCSVGPLCPAGLRLHHSGHSSLQVRRASHFNSVRVCDIQKVVDVSSIQTYIINNAKIVFLLARPRCRELQQHRKDHAKHGGSAKVCCLHCQRNLTDLVSYCSIECKLIGVREKLDDSSLSIAAGVVRPSKFMDQSISNEFQKETAIPAYNCCDDVGAQEAGVFRFSPAILKKRRWNAADVHGSWNAADVHGTPMKQPSAVRELFLPEQSKRPMPQESKRRIAIGRQDSPPAPGTPPSMDSASLRAGHRRKGTPHRAPLQ